MTFPASIPASLQEDGSHRDSRMVLIRDLTLPAHIGVYDREMGHSQTVRINVALVVEDLPVDEDSMDNVVCYDTIVQKIKALIAEGHVKLVETLAERIAGLCLDNGLVLEARIRVEKLDAIPETEAVGIEIIRKKATAGLITRQG